MKITTATCNRASSRGDGEYFARVCVSSDEVNLCATAEANDPKEAIHKAMAQAIGMHTAKLHESVNIAIEVKF
jgi:hypothetical protein